MKMKPYVVRQGDFLSKLAFRFHFDANQVWNDSKNDDLRKKRPDPRMLCPNDVLFIPDGERKFLSVNLGDTNSFESLVPTCKIKMRLTTGGEPLKSVACKLTGLDKPLDLETDGDGNVTFEAPIDAAHLRLEVSEPPIVYPVKLGHLDPPEEPSGIAMRLVHLGYADRVSLSPKGLTAAVRLFQSKNGIKPTGILDDATRKEILSQHGC